MHPRYEHQGVGHVEAVLVSDKRRALVFSCKAVKPRTPRVLVVQRSQRTEPLRQVLNLVQARPRIVVDRHDVELLYERDDQVVINVGDVYRL